MPEQSVSVQVVVEIFQINLKWKTRSNRTFIVISLSFVYMCYHPSLI